MSKWPHKKLGVQDLGGQTVNVLAWCTGEDREGNEVPVPIYEKADVRQPNGPASFPEPRSMGDREWGTETLLLLAPSNYTLKLITMKAGAKGGLQYHHKKDEGGIILKGSMIVRYDPGNGTLVERMCRKGDVFHFPQGSVHQSEAITPVSYIEVSTPFFNDRVHVEHEYGQEKEAGGLPSTKLEDVEAA